MTVKRLAILGSTGSIGTQTLDVVRSHPERFHVTVLAANTSDEALLHQIEEFSPKTAVLVDETAAARLRAQQTQLGRENEHDVFPPELRM